MKREGQDIEHGPDPDFSSAKSMAELYMMITAAGIVKGGSKTYTAREIKDLIGAALDLKVSVKAITNTGGLRDKVVELMKTEGKAGFLDAEERFRIIGEIEIEGDQEGENNL